MSDSTATIVEEMDCDVCQRPCQSPTGICVSGHIFCIRCDIATETCGVCGLQKRREDDDSERLNTMVFTRREQRPPIDIPRTGTSREDTPVPQTDSCSCSLKNGHEEFCPSNIVPCPLHCVSGCTWLGKFKETFVHCEKEHPLNTFSTNKKTLYARKNVPGNNCHILFKAYEKLFLFASYINTSRTLIKWSVIYLGPREEAEDYDYQIEIKSQSKFVMMRNSCQPLPFTINNDTQLITGNYLSEPVVFNEKDQMCYTFFILEKDNIDVRTISEKSDRLLRLIPGSENENSIDSESII